MFHLYPAILKQAKHYFPKQATYQKSPGALIKHTRFWPQIWFVESGTLGTEPGNIYFWPAPLALLMHLIRRGGWHTRPSRCSPWWVFARAKFKTPVCAHWRQLFTSQSVIRAAHQMQNFSDTIGDSFNNCFIGQFISQLGKREVWLVAVLCTLVKACMYFLILAK